jgi:hypothetical protein
VIVTPAPGDVVPCDFCVKGTVDTPDEQVCATIGSLGPVCAFADSIGNYVICFTSVPMGVQTLTVTDDNGSTSESVDVEC